MAKKSEKTPAPAAVKSHLITMTREGCDPIQVHPTQVLPWQAQGWKVEEE